MYYQKKWAIPPHTQGNVASWLVFMKWQKKLLGEADSQPQNNAIDLNAPEYQTPEFKEKVAQVLEEMAKEMNVK